MGSPIAPLLEMLKQAVIVATASHIFISANTLPGHILAHISGLRGLVQVWKHLPTSKAKYQLLWIKWLAVNEALGTKRFRIIIYFRVSSQSPEKYF